MCPNRLDSQWQPAMRMQYNEMPLTTDRRKPKESKKKYKQREGIETPREIIRKESIDSTSSYGSFEYVRTSSPKSSISFDTSLWSSELELSLQSLDSGCDLEQSLDLEEQEAAGGSRLTFNIPDGRMETDWAPVTLKVKPVEGQDLFQVKLATKHYAFSQRRSSTFRPVGDFYFLQYTLSALHPYAKMPSLPARARLWLRSPTAQAATIAAFLALVLAEYDCLSNKALHLFLQSDLSIQRIQDNLDGSADDEVLTTKELKDIRRNRRSGFMEIFSD